MQLQFLHHCLLPSPQSLPGTTSDLQGWSPPTKTRRLLAVIQSQVHHVHFVLSLHLDLRTCFNHFNVHFSHTVFDHLTDTHKHPVRGNNRLLVPSFFPTSPPVLPLTPRNQTRTKAPLPCEIILHFLVPQRLPQTSQVSQDDCATENCQTEAPRMGQTPTPQSPLNKPTENEYAL